jgi:hypothetical protein
MMADETDKPQRRQRPLTLWRVLGGLLLLAMAGLLGMRWHWRAEFHRQIAAIRAAGYPVTPQELDAWYPWPASGNNAAYWITGAAACYCRLPQEEGTRLDRIIRSGEGPDPTEPIPDDDKALLEQYIWDNFQALKTLHDASTIAECRFPVELSKGPSTEMPHIADVRDGARLLCLAAVLRAEQGDASGAARAVEAAVQITRSLEQEPVMISHLVYAGMSVRAAVALERALNQVEFSSEQLTRLYRVFVGIRMDDGLVRALAGHRCASLTVFENPQALDRSYFERLPPVAVLEVYGALGLAAREGTIFLAHMNECLRVAQLPAFRRPPALRALEAYDRRRGRALLLGLADTGYAPRVIQLEMKYAAQIELARTSLAVQRFRRACARLPETLDPLVPDYLAAIPQDPFDGAPLRYQRLERSFMVYSVGEDGRDDGGKTEPRRGKKKQGESFDLVFRVER